MEGRCARGVVLPRPPGLLPAHRGRSPMCGRTLGSCPAWGQPPSRGSCFTVKQVGSHGCARTGLTSQCVRLFDWGHAPAAPNHHRTGLDGQAGSGLCPAQETTSPVTCNSEVHLTAICYSFCNLNLSYLSPKIEKKKNLDVLVLNSVYLRIAVLGKQDDTSSSGFISPWIFQVANMFRIKHGPR